MAKKANSDNPQTGTPTKFVVTGSPVKTKAAQEKDKNKGKEPWRHKLVSGKAHPDNKGDVTKVAEPSPENKKKYEDSINAEREKHNLTTNWWDLEGGERPDEPEQEAPFRYGPADSDPRIKAEVKEEAQFESKSKDKGKSKK